MSINLLNQIQGFVKQGSQANHPTCKTLSNMCVFLDDNVTVKHLHADDVESLFYVLVWIMVLYDGLLGHE